MVPYLKYEYQCRLQDLKCTNIVEGETELFAAEDHSPSNLGGVMLLQGLAFHKSFSTVLNGIKVSNKVIRRAFPVGDKIHTTNTMVV